MTDELERLIRAHGSQDISRLDGVEDAVWTRVETRRAQRRLTRTQGAALGLSLVIGLTNGGLLMLSPRPAPSEMSVFSVSTGLAPLNVGVG
ncbi:MAG: hypothetical protein EBR82_21695 [Caulobacteraceae bacterium]|nr:hypothetical protein [Caulobacteraceae bacterium]